MLRLAVAHSVFYRREPQSPRTCTAAMLKLPSRLRRLDAALADLPGDEEPLLLTELDGFLAGVAVCPELILPGEWLPMVWGGGDGAPFYDAADVEQFARMVIAHHHEILRGMDNGRYQPTFDIDERHGEVMWELWIEGFALAMTLRPESWPEVLKDEDGDVAAAGSGMLMLIEIARDESDLTRELIDKVTDQAPDLIPTWIALLHGRRLARAGSVVVERAPSIKVGRNKPCPCRSGKKYKKCCGLS